MSSTEYTHDEWMAEGRRRFGEDTMQWRFVCPSCGHEASVQDWKDAGAPVAAAGFSCVGRWIEGARRAFDDTAGPGPCNYAGGGLFKINPIVVGGDMTAFAFAEPAEATA